MAECLLDKHHGTGDAYQIQKEKGTNDVKKKREAYLLVGVISSVFIFLVCKRPWTEAGQ